MPWQCVPDRVYPVSGYGPPKNINLQAAFQNRSNNNPDTGVAVARTSSPATAVDSNRNSSGVQAADDSTAAAATTTKAAPATSIKSSKSFESGVLGQHANTPNGVIPWPGDRGKQRPPQWDHHQQQQHQQHQQQHNNGPYNGGGSHHLYNGTSSSPYVANGSTAHHNGGSNEHLYLGNRSSAVRSSSRGPPTYFSPQHNHVSARDARHSPWFSRKIRKFPSPVRSTLHAKITFSRLTSNLVDFVHVRFKTLITLHFRDENILVCYLCSHNF